ncbi:hypothetical protein PM082_005410 [Marasmius tenuissimus]|nr:hypothetical protein PM082_005410 [Marasmius tenuissimus]
MTGLKGSKQASVETRKQESLELDTSDEDEAEFTPESSECESPQPKRKLRNKSTNVKRKEKSHTKTQDPLILQYWTVSHYEPSASTLHEADGYAK